MGITVYHVQITRSKRFVKPWQSRTHRQEDTNYHDISYISLISQAVFTLHYLTSHITQVVNLKAEYLYQVLCTCCTNTKVHKNYL